MIHKTPNFGCSALFPSFLPKFGQNNLEGLILAIFQSLPATHMDLMQKEDYPGDSCAISHMAFLLSYASCKSVEYGDIPCVVLYFHIKM